VGKLLIKPSKEAVKATLATEGERLRAAANAAAQLPRRGVSLALVG
jgi:hypothetical protein